MNQGRVGLASDTHWSSPLSAPSHKDLRPPPNLQLNAQMQTQMNQQMQKHQHFFVIVYQIMFISLFYAENKINDTFESFRLSQSIGKIKEQN